MRKIIILTFITISNLSIGQTVNNEFNNQIKDIILTIRKNLPLQNQNILIKKSEYFVFDLTLNKDGRLKNIDILRRDSSYNINSIRPILSIIKNKWKPVKSKYIKILIPLIFTFEEEDVDGDILNENGTIEIDYFFKYLKNKNNILYVSDRISIHFPEPRK